MRNRQHKLAAVVVCALLLLQAAFAFGIPAVAETSGNTPTMTVGSVTAKPGETVTVPVTVTNNPGISAFTLSVDYDSSAMTLVGAKQGDALGGTYSFDQNCVWIGSGNYTENGTILELSFTLSEAARGELPVSVSYGPGDICNWELESVGFNVVPGAVRVYL